MAVAKAKARTVTRDPEPEAAPRMEEARMPERDPNKIYTRDGRVVDIGRVKSQNDDRLNLAAMGIFPPKGWTYEWRTVTVKNAPWTQAISDDEERGWTPVPASRHPGKIMPRGFEGPIEYNGLMLKERDERLTALAKRHEKKAADEQLNISRSMTGLMGRAVPNASPEAMDFSHGDAKSRTGVSIERIPMGDPDKNYTYTLDE